MDLKTSFTYVAFGHDHDSFSIVVCKQWIKSNEFLYVRLHILAQTMKLQFFSQEINLFCDGIIVWTDTHLHLSNLTRTLFSDPIVGIWKACVTPSVVFCLTVANIKQLWINIIHTDTNLIAFFLQ